ncbi:MAG: hypothetical protein SFW66_06510 [Gammaproteobacteria bacterium]|nr:hypothetical protein [Gammaproteobacteria bacterium]
MSHNKKSRVYFMPNQGRRNANRRFVNQKDFIFVPEPRYGINYSLFMLLGLSALIAANYPLSAERDKAFYRLNDDTLKPIFFAEKYAEKAPHFFGNGQAHSVNRQIDQKIFKSLMEPESVTKRCRQ